MVREPAKGDVRPRRYELGRPLAWTMVVLSEGWEMCRLLALLPARKLGGGSFLGLASVPATGFVTSEKILRFGRHELRPWCQNFSFLSLCKKIQAGRRNAFARWVTSSANVERVGRLPFGHTNGQNLDKINDRLGSCFGGYLNVPCFIGFKLFPL